MEQALLTEGQGHLQHMLKCQEASSAAVPVGGGWSVPTLPAVQGAKCHVDIIKNETLAYQSSLPLPSLFYVLCASVSLLSIQLGLSFVKATFFSLSYCSPRIFIISLNQNEQSAKNIE